MTVSNNGFKMVPEAFWFYAGRRNRFFFLFLPGAFRVGAPYNNQQTAQQRQHTRPTTPH